MKKFLKVSGIILAVFLVLIVALPILFQGKIKSFALNKANEQLNAQIDFGKLSLSLIRNFPNFSLKLKDVSIVGVEEFERDTLFSGNIGLSIDFMSVIRGNYEIKSIVLDNPKINVIITKEGKANYDITIPTDEEEKIDEEESDFNLKLKKIAINNANIVYDDRESGTFVKIENLNFNGNGNLAAEVSDFQFFLDIEKFTTDYGGVRYLNNTQLHWDAVLETNIKEDKYTFKENTFLLNALEISLNGFVRLLENGYEMDLSSKLTQTDFKNLLSLIPVIYANDFEEVKTHGKFDFDFSAKGIYNDEVYPQFAVNLGVKDGSFQYPKLPKSAQNIQVNLNIENPGGSFDNTVINLQKFDMNLAGNPFSLKLIVKTPDSDPYIDAVFRTDLNLASLKDVVPTESKDFAQGRLLADLTLKGNQSAIESQNFDRFIATGNVDFSDFRYTSDLPGDGLLLQSMKMNFTPKFVELSTFKGLLDKTPLNASGRLENFIGYFFGKGDLIGRLDLSTGILDLNKLLDLSPATESNTQTATTSSSSAEPVLVPKNIDFTLNASMAKIIYQELELENASGTIIVKDEKLSIRNLKSSMLGGSFLINGYYSTVNPLQPTMNFEMDIRDFDIRQTFDKVLMVRQLAPIAKQVNGKFSTSTKITGPLGADMMPDMMMLNGRGTLSTGKVIVDNLEILNQIADVLKINKYRTLTLDKTNFMFEILNGRFFVQPFDLKFGNVTGVLGGSNGLDQSIDYVLNLRIPRSEFGGAANTVLNNMVGEINKKGVNYQLGEFVDIRLDIGGFVTKPTVKANIREGANNLKDDLKNAVKDKIDDVKKEAEDKLKGEIDKQKEELERQKAEAERKAREEADRQRAEAERKAKEEADRLKKEAEDKAKQKARDLIKRP